MTNARQRRVTPGALLGLRFSGGLLAALLLLAPAAAGAQERAPRGDWDDAIDHQERFRTYHVHVPPGYDPARPAPLVLAFHGRGGSGKGLARLSRFNRLADAGGFIVVYPDGVGGSWNDGRSLSPATQMQVDDVGFVRSLLAELQGRLNVDPDGIYAAGISNGAVFAQRLAGALDGAVRAVAAVAGLLSSQVPLPARLVRPVSFLLIHGTADPVVPWAGGEVLGGSRALSAPETAARWAALNGCPPTAERQDEPDRDPTDGTRVRRERWGPCRGGSEVVLYAIEGGGHTWPGGPPLAPAFGRTSRDLDGSRTIMEFFERHRLQRQAGDRRHPPPVSSSQSPSARRAGSSLN